MNFKNEISCPNCGYLNFDFEFKCKNCKSFLRERIININLGETLLRIIDSPKEALQKIKLSEHKNYILLILTFISIRFLILSRFISVPFSNNLPEYNIFTLIGTSLAITLALINLITFILQRAFLISRVKTKFADILAVLTYSNIPNVIALLILFPLELVFFGEYIFSNNPYPYQIKEGVFYFLLILEILTILWSIFLTFIGLKEFIKNNFLSTVFTLISWLLIFTVLSFQSKIFQIK